MTRLLPDERCACGSLLVPLELAFGFTVPQGTEYVCLRCGRAFRWVGNPPTLTLFVAAERLDGDDEDDDAARQR